MSYNSMCMGSPEEVEIDRRRLRIGSAPMTERMPDYDDQGYFGRGEKLYTDRAGNTYTEWQRNLEVLRLHHEHNLSAEDIAHRFGTSISSIYRCLSEAKRLGVVRTTIDAAAYFELRNNRQLEHELLTAFPAL